MPNPYSPQLIRSAPYFPVADVEQSAVHYEREVPSKEAA